MRLLIIDDNKAARESAARVLSLAQFEVEQADARTGLAVVGQAKAEVVLFAWPEKGGPELIKRVRGCESGGHVYVLVLLDKQPATRPRSSSPSAWTRGP
jgi:DNA-binding response OmpR family regulator